jgi:hypothetical protein
MMTLAKRSLLLLPIAVLISVVILGVFTPLSTPRIFLNQRRAVLSIAELSLAERRYSTLHPSTGYAGKLGDLGDQGLVDRVLGSGTRTGYHFEIRCLQEDGQKVTSYTITAEPTSRGTTGKYALCADESGETCYSEEALVSNWLTMRKPVEEKYKR